MAQANVLTRASGSKTSKINRPRPRRVRQLLLIAVIASIGLAAVLWQVVDHGPRGAGRGSTAPAIAAPYSVPEAVFAAQPPFTGPAVAKYGQPALQRAYRQLVNFALNTGWNLTLMAKAKTALTTADFAAVRASLTPSCAKTFDSTVAKALANDKAAIRELEGSMFFAVGGTGKSDLVGGTASVSKRAFTRAKFAVDTAHGRQRLSMSFTVKALVHMQDAAGKQFVVPTARAVRFLLVPNFGADVSLRPFRIDAWASHLQTKKRQPA